jgi:hypothetical protein
MSDVALLLGPVAFQNFELPSAINFGGTQRLAVHRLAGGGRVVDALGRDDAEICFSGTFSGPDATSRARVLDEMRASGLPLTWDVLFYTVVIRKFEADYRNGWWIPYHLTCCVLRDEASTAVQPTQSASASIQTDTATAASLAASVGFNIAPARTAVSALDATNRGSSDFARALLALNASRAELSQAIVEAEVLLNGSGLVEAVSAGEGAAGLGRAAQASQQLAILTTASGYLGRAATSLMNVGT